MDYQPCRSTPYPYDTIEHLKAKTHSQDTPLFQREQTEEEIRKKHREPIDQVPI